MPDAHDHRRVMDVSTAMHYLMTVPAGSTELAERALRSLRPDATVTFRDDSAVAFCTRHEIPDADTVPFAKNVFAVAARVPRRNLAASVHALSRGLPRIRPVRDGFRVVLHVDGALAAVDRSARTTLERCLARATGARPDPRGGGEEFWVVGRRDLDEFVLGRRLHRRRSVPTPRGALAPELATLVALVSEPDRRDVVLDPYAGSGALLLARRARPFHVLHYNDRRPGLPQGLREDRRVRCTHDDARVLGSVPSGSVSAVITDPPWNEHEVVEDYGSFAAAACDAFARVLSPRHGRAVVLVGRRGADLFTARLDAAGLASRAVAEILVNGHPATVLLGVSPGRTGARGSAIPRARGDCAPGS